MISPKNVRTFLRTFKPSLAGKFILVTDKKLPQVIHYQGYRAFPTRTATITHL